MNRYLLLLSLTLVPGWFGHEGTAAGSSEQSPSSLSGQAELRGFLNCQLVPRLGNAWDYTFTPGKFPRIEWDRPEVVEKVMGSFPLKIRWFDGEGNEVMSPDQPGRYAFYAEGTTSGGKTIRRAAALYCRPKNWDGWSEKPRAYLDFLPVDGLTWMRQAHPQAGMNGIPKDTTVLSRNVIGHGSATSAILRVDLDHELVICQTRRRGGADYDKHVTEFLIAVEAGLN